MYWYQSNPGRFEMEKRLLGRHYPHSKIVKKDGILRVVLRYRTPNASYLIEAVYPKRFPYAAMEVYIMDPPLKHSPPHRFSGGRLCLHGDSDIGPETTAIIYLDWTRQWIRCYESWLVTRKWPSTNRQMNR